MCSHTGSQWGDALESRDTVGIQCAAALPQAVIPFVFIQHEAELKNML